MKYQEYLLPGSIVLAALLIGSAWVYTARLGSDNNKPSSVSAETVAAPEDAAALEAEIWPSQEVELPVKWGDLGKRLVENGVIDKTKFEAVYKDRGGLSDSDAALLAGENNDQLKISHQNSNLLLNLLWALGLGNKNDILEKGPMNDPQYGGADGFASTGGWTLAGGEAMNHYSQHRLIELTAAEQALVEQVSKNIYRPCCNNATYFPDCNHGMAMLGLLELGASQGLSEGELYQMALVVNSYWFPDTYLTIAKFLKAQGQSWRNTNPAEILGYNFSSGSGYRQILSQVTPAQSRSGGACGV